MKRTERQHLKQDELTMQLLRARAVVEERRREVTAAVVAIVIVGAALLGYMGWRARVQSRSYALLAEATAVQDARIAAPPPAPATTPASTPPAPTPVATAGEFPNERARSEAAVVKFRAVADSYPSTDAGLYARYQQAALLMSLDRPADAITAYQELIKHGGDGVYSQMARLGLAEAQVRAKQFEPAINALKELAQRKDGPLPIDGVLIQLGRAYLDAGRITEAQQTFNRVVEEYPDSPYNGEARKQLESLKKT